MKSLVERLGAANRPLLERMLDFSDGLNIEIVQALAPRLVVVPLSVGRSRSLDAIRPLGLTLNNAIERRPHTILLPEGTFTCFTGTCHRGTLMVRTLFLRHPASLRLSRESKSRLVDGLATILTAVQ
jgi:hypothetical protein